MTDTTETSTREPEPRPPDPHPRDRWNPAGIGFTALAVVAVLALAVVALVAIVNRDDGRGTMMGTSRGMPASMMGSGQMTGGLMMGGSMMGQGSTNPTVAGAREIAVSATSYRFQPDEIHVRAGEDVTIILAASDIAHDFTIDELGFHVAATPGRLGRGGLHAPSTPGRYTAYCSVAGHRQAGMTATVVVDPA